MYIALLSGLVAQALPSKKPVISAMSMSQLMMLIGGIGVLTIIMIFTHRRVKRSMGQNLMQSARELNRQRVAQAGVGRGAIRDMEAVMFELEDLSRQIHGRISTQFAKLEAVIRDADERIEKLSRLTRESKGEPTIDITVANSSGLPAVPPPESASAPNHVNVYQLADSGLSANQIATRLGKPTGEVELILSLRKVRTQAELEPKPFTTTA